MCIAASELFDDISAGHEERGQDQGTHAPAHVYQRRDRHERRDERSQLQGEERECRGF
jgi:hypothetical protein